MDRHYHLRNPISGKMITVFVANEIYLGPRRFCKCGMVYKSPEPKGA